MRRVISFVVLQLVAAWLLGLATEASARADAPKWPASVPNSDALAGKDWTVELSVDGAIDGDDQPDRVVVLLHKQAGDDEDRARVLLILLRRDTGYAVAAVNTKLLACYQCLGVKGGTATPEIELARGVLTVTQSGGSRYWYASVHRFRYAQREGRMVWIGLDESSGDSASGEETNVSHNYLTGRRITEHTPPQLDDEGNEVEVKTTHKVEKLARKPLLRFEDVRSAFAG